MANLGNSASEKRREPEKGALLHVETVGERAEGGILTKFAKECLSPTLTDFVGGSDYGSMGKSQRCLLAVDRIDVDSNSINAKAGSGNHPVYSTEWVQNPA